MDPIIEEEEDEDYDFSNPLQPMLRAAPATSTPIKTPKKHKNTTDEPDYTFTPSKLIPRNKYTDQPPLWPPPPTPACDFIECHPRIDQTHQAGAGHRRRPSLLKSRSSGDLDIEEEPSTVEPTETDLSRKGSKKRSKLELAKSILKLRSKSAKEVPSHPGSDQENKSSNKPSNIPTREPLYRAITLPIDNVSPRRVSLVAFGLKLPANWGQAPAPKPPPKPYDSRFCDGCHKFITLSKKQYICNDKKCRKRLCDDCYRIWLDSKYQGRLIKTDDLQTIHAATSFRQYHYGNILPSKEISLRDKIDYLGEATSYEIGAPIHFQGRRLDIASSASSSSSRTRQMNLDPLTSLFGKHAVAMTFRPSARTAESKITANMSPTRFKNLSWMYAGSGSTSEIWGWDYALAKRRAAVAGRPAPAFPRRELQPPTTTASVRSSARTIVSISPVSLSSRSDSITTVSTLAL